MASRANTEIDVSAYSVAVATNGAFGFRATVEAMPEVTGTAKTSDGAIAAARAKLRKRLAAMEAAGTAVSPPPAPLERPHLLELLKAADATAPADFMEKRRLRAAFLSEFDAASRDIQALLCNLLVLEDFTKPLAYEADRRETDDGITAQIRAWTDAQDLNVALGAEIHLPRASGGLVVRSVRAGLKRTSTKRYAELPILIHDLPEGGGPAIYTDEVYAAFTSLISELSLAAEAARPPEPPAAPTPDAYWEAIDDLEERVKTLEGGTSGQLSKLTLE